MIIQSKPMPKLKHYFHRNNNIGLFFYKLGRLALLDCLLRFGLEKGDSIIVPSYICFSTIEPLKSYGFEIIYLEPNDNLSYDIEILKATVENGNRIKAILLVYFFGLNVNFSETYDLMKKFNIKVINDFSHSCFMKIKSSNSEENADASIYSFRKSLPVGDGGALSIAGHCQSNIEIKSCLSKISTLIYFISRNLEKIICSVNINIYSQFVTYLRSIRSHSDKTNLDHLAQCKPSKLLVNILSDNIYMSSSEKRIRQNLLYLISNIDNKKINIFLKDSSLDSVPQALILRDNSGLLCGYLRKNGIGAWKWPDNEIPEEVSSNLKKFPIANRLNNELVLVPIHQDLGMKQMSFIIEKLTIWDFK